MSVHFSQITDNRSTPSELYNHLDKEFCFNFDLAPLSENPQLDGLETEWGSRTFCNPPYSKLKKWCQKAYQESLKGKLVVMLIPSRTDTIAWHDYCMRADEIRFIKGRLKFGNSKNSAPFPSAIIVFKGNATYKYTKTNELKSEVELESQIGAQFFKKDNHSQEWRESVAKHFWSAAVEAARQEMQVEIDKLKKIAQWYKVQCEVDGYTVTNRYKATCHILKELNQGSKDE